MTVYELLLIAFALSLDAFGVSISIGFCRTINKINKVAFALSFGFFQFVFSLVGSYIGIFINTYVTSISQVVGGIIIFIVGIIMIKDGINEKEENILISARMYIILGVTVSIDAAVIGFTILNKISNSFVIVFNTMFIGVVAFIMSCLAFFISKYLNKVKIVHSYADYIGGIILIMFGIKMIFS